MTLMQRLRSKMKKKKGAAAKSGAYVHAAETALRTAHLPVFTRASVLAMIHAAAKRTVKAADSLIDDPTYNPAKQLVGWDAPHALLQLVQRGLDTCFAGGGTSPDCEGRSLLEAKDAGWYKTMGGWVQRDARAYTFAEKLDEDGNAPTFVMDGRELGGAGGVEIAVEGLASVGKDEATGEEIFIDFTPDILAAMAANTNELHARIDPCVTLGHLEDADVETLPKGGLVGELFTTKREDGKISLRAKTITAIPAAFARVLENKGANRVSIEADMAYIDAETSRVLPVLKRVSLCGGVKPRIDGQDQLPNLYREDSNLIWVDTRREPVVRVQHPWKRDGMKIAAAEGATGPAIVRAATIALTSATGQKEVDMDIEKLAALIIAGLKKALEDGSAGGGEAATATGAGAAATGATAATPATPAIVPATAAAAAAPAADPVMDELRKITARLDTFESKQTAQDATLAATSDTVTKRFAADRAEDDAALVESLIKSNTILPADAPVLAAKFSELDRIVNIRLDEKGTLGTAGDRERNFWLDLQKRKVVAIDLGEKAKSEGATIPGMEFGPTAMMKRHNINPETAAQGIAASLAGTNGLTLSASVARIVEGSGFSS